MRKTLFVSFTLPVWALVSACRMSDMQPDASLGRLTDSAIPSATAGQRGWMYAQRARADFDSDGQIETAVMISDVTLDNRGTPLWEDGHRWQVYIEEPTGERTYLFRQFLPNGKLTAEVVRRESGTHTVLLIAHTAQEIGIFEVKYSGPQRIVLMNGLARPVEAGETFTGSPRP